MVNYRMRAVGRSVASLLVVTGSVLLPAGAASAAPMPPATPVTTQALVSVRDTGQALAITGGLQPPPGEQDRRLGNGELIRPGTRTGRGELTVDNGGAHDAVITLAMNKQPAFSVYVRNGSKHKVTGIRDGTYEIFFTTGVDWDSQNRNFTRERALQRFDNTLTFTTTRTPTEIRWSTWTLTLQPVADGNASTRGVNPDEYPAV